MLSAILQGSDQGSSPPRRLPSVSAGNSNNITLEKKLQVVQRQCRVLGHGADSGSLVSFGPRYWGGSAGRWDPRAFFL